MIKAYFDYNPTGSSLLAIEHENGVDTTQFNIEKPQDLVDVIAVLVSSNNVNQLFCNKFGLELGASIKARLLDAYGYTSCEILLNK